MNGISFWSDIFISNETAIIFMKADVRQTHDSSMENSYLFAISALLSSVTFYTLSTAISDRHLEKFRVSLTPDFSSSFKV
jgi:hypothetical protein